MSYDAIFFSPHLDDAMLSCGGLIIDLIRNKKKVLVITCFTNAKNSNRLSTDALKFSQNLSLGKIELLPPNKLFLNRKKEDKKVSKMIGFNIVHLNFIDALFRFSKNNQLYPSFKKVFSGIVHTNDADLEKKLTKTILEKIQGPIGEKLQNNNTKLFFPLGIGGHVDHIITFNISKKIKHYFKKNIYYWHDIPYKNHLELMEKRYAQLNKKSSKNRFIVLNNKSSEKKKKALELYSTQILGLKKSGLGGIDFLKEQIIKL